MLCDLLPHEHTGYRRLDEEVRRSAYQTKAQLEHDGRTVLQLLDSARDALDDALDDRHGGVLCSPAPLHSATRPVPARTSLRSPKPHTTTKHVTFATGKDDEAPAPAPRRSSPRTLPWLPRTPPEPGAVSTEPVYAGATQPWPAPQERANASARPRVKTETRTLTPDTTILCEKRPKDRARSARTERVPDTPPQLAPLPLDMSTMSLAPTEERPGRSSPGKEHTPRTPSAPTPMTPAPSYAPMPRAAPRTGAAMHPTRLTRAERHEKVLGSSLFSRSKTHARMAGPLGTTSAAHRLRRLSIPASLLPTFLSYASMNTSMGRETCGLLLGKERHGQLVVTVLLLPPQTGSRDQCVAEGEEATAAFQLAHGLLSLGWVHTHPAQTCFLSSLDLHTQAGYQALLPEAVAVVCAPHHTPPYGVFRLIDPDGLREVLECHRPEPFHPHGTHDDKGSGASLYMDATRTHAALDPSAPAVHVRDMRMAGAR